MAYFVEDVPVLIAYKNIVVEDFPPMTTQKAVIVENDPIVILSLPPLPDYGQLYPRTV